MGQVHHRMDRYGKNAETNLKENQKRFYEALDNTIPVDKYFEIIDDCIWYADDDKQPYTADHIIKNLSDKVLSMGMYTEIIKMRHKKL